VPAPRLALAAAVLLAAAGVAAGSLPLLEVPGYELGALGALAVALALGPALGVAAARADARSPALAAARAAATALGLLGVLLLASLARAALGPCDPLFGLPLFLAAAAPPALLSPALAVLVATAAPRRPVLAYAAVAAASLATTLARAYLGPAASLFDHLLGWWPGPIYDEALVLDRRVVLFRAATVLLAVAAAALAQALARRSRRALAVAALAAGAAIPLHLAGGPATRAEIARALGAVRDGPRCTLHLPREKPAADADRLHAECERDVDEIAAALGIAAPPHVTVFAYRSPAEKRRLVGAGETDYTKPWLAEIHVEASPRSPHPVLRHEVVHAVASVLAPGPLHIPARARLLPSGALLEGLAVALTPRTPYGLHQRARVLRDLRLTPPMSSLLGDASFFSAPPARAYTAAGSFVRWLLDTRGPAPVAQAYGDLDLARAFGEPLSALEAEWNRFLDGVTVPPELRAEAEARFRHPGLFGMRCAREVASRSGGFAPR
jgi:hypothetical protein